MNIQLLVEKQSKLLNAIGIKNEVFVSGGVVILSVEKGNACVIRKAIKKVKLASTGSVTEARSETMVTFAWVDDAVALTKKEVLAIMA